MINKIRYYCDDCYKELKIGDEIDDIEYKDIYIEPCQLCLDNAYNEGCQDGVEYESKM